MEVEPFQDTIPPRHQVESDDSDEDMDPGLSIKRPIPKSVLEVVVHWKGPQSKRQPLLVALNQAGRRWTRGITLDDSEVKGEVVVGDVKIASIFTPIFAEVAILTLSVRLPTYTMHAVATTIISAMRPTNVVIIDTYPTPSYISSSPASLEPPIRYLRTNAASKHSPPPEDAQFFQTPNLIQSPAASFLTILESLTHATPATLLLLPSAHIPPPAPSELEGTSGPEDREDWEPSILTKLDKMVGFVIGIDLPWSAQNCPDRSIRVKASRKGDIGEGGMYI